MNLDKVQQSLETNNNTVRSRFITLNSKRIERTQALLRPKQKVFLEILPLLFHINNRALPGYVGMDTPCGVSAYALDDHTAKTARKTWPSFDEKKQAQFHCCIESIFVMGSAGSVAFSKKSDLDFWLCHRGDIPADKLELLQKKATDIEKWAETLGIEAHFFLMNADEFRAGHSSIVSSESSGSAQHRLLLDEFYRTSIWIAGKHPVWWFIPPHEEHNYASIKQQLFDKKILDNHECIDFGSLPNIPIDEFFGAAVWQVLKGVDSPYKSILKISLMEIYATEYPNAIPLSTRLKQKVYYATEIDLDELDPYIILLNTLEAYFETQKDSLRKESVRRSFYFKIGILASKRSSKEKTDWRHQLIKKLIQEWGWKDKQLERLDSRSDWKIDDVILERKLLLDHLTKSYLFLSTFAKDHNAKSKINTRDLNILGRKLYAVFEAKPGKIEIVNRGISDDIAEDRITIMLAQGADKQDRWLMFRDKVIGSQINQHKPLKKTTGLVELLAWGIFNSVINTTTSKLLYAPGCELNQIELNTIIEKLQQIFSSPDALQSDTEALLLPATVESTSLFLNVGKIPKITSNYLDKDIISGNIDILQPGSWDESLMVSIEFSYINSWKEVFSLRYNGMQGMFDFLSQFLSLSFDKNGKLFNNIPAIPNAHSFSTSYGHALTRRINDILNTLDKLYFQPNSNTDTLFVIEAVGNYVGIYKKRKNDYSYTIFKTFSQLASALGTKRKTYKAVYFEKTSDSKTPIPEIYRYNQEGIIQIFYECEGKRTYIYILDEFGTLFNQKFNDIKTLPLLGSFYQLIKNSILLNEYADEIERDQEALFSKNEALYLELYRVKKTSDKHSIEQRSLADIRFSTPAIDMTLTMLKNEQKTEFSINLGDTQFKSEALGAKLFEHVAKQLDNNNSHSGAIFRQAKIEPIRKTGTQYKTPTIELLEYKKRVEMTINKFLVR